MSGPYVYERASGEAFYVVGYYDPSGKWRTEQDCGTAEEAAARVAWLNGGAPPSAKPPHVVSEVAMRLYCRADDLDAYRDAFRAAFANLPGGAR